MHAWWVMHAWWLYRVFAADTEARHLTNDAKRGRADAHHTTLGEKRDVEVEASAVQGQQASAALVDAAKDAVPLVVGSRGAGGFSGLRRGSVSQQCAHHASFRSQSSVMARQRITHNDLWVRLACPRRRARERAAEAGWATLEASRATGIGSRSG
jgi:hypothetical protein